MKNLLVSLLAIFVRVPSTDKAIAGITNALTELEAVVAFENKSADLLDAQIVDLIASQNAAKDRADRASKIAKRFGKLVA